MRSRISLARFPFDSSNLLVFYCGNPSRISGKGPTAAEMEAFITMARLVRHDETGPYEIPEGTELPAWICGCGLSKNKPYCDGTHKKTRDEGDQLFTYDGDKRTPVK